jgi:hypothetical protein
MMPRLRPLESLMRIEKWVTEDLLFVIVKPD